LKGAEEMLGGSDTPISAEEAARLSRPAPPQPPAKKGAGGTSTKGDQPPTVIAAPPPAGGDADIGAPLRPGIGAPGQPKVRIIPPAPPKNP
jgi:hypothetical protein